MSMANNRKKMLEIELEKMKSQQKQEGIKQKEEYENMATRYILQTKSLHEIGGSDVCIVIKHKETISKSFLTSQSLLRIMYCYHSTRPSARTYVYTYVRNFFCYFCFFGISSNRGHHGQDHFYI